MRKLVFALVALLMLAIASFLIFSSRFNFNKGDEALQQSTLAQPNSPAANSAQETHSAPEAKTDKIDQAPTNQSPGGNSITPPLQTPSAVKTADGRVISEVADLGDGRGPVARQFRYDEKGLLIGELRSNATTGQPIESIEYLHTDDGKVSTRIIDPAGNITFVTPDGKITKPDGTRID